MFEFAKGKKLGKREAPAWMKRFNDNVKGEDGDRMARILAATLYNLGFESGEAETKFNQGYYEGVAEAMMATAPDSKTRLKLAGITADGVEEGKAFRKAAFTRKTWNA